MSGVLGEKRDAASPNDTHASLLEAAPPSDPLAVLFDAAHPRSHLHQSQIRPRPTTPLAFLFDEVNTSQVEGEDFFGQIMQPRNQYRK